MSSHEIANPPEDRPSSATIRRAVLADLEGMAHVHVDGWKTTYRGMVPDEILDHMSVESDIAAGFGKSVREPRPNEVTFVAVIPGSGIVGYALCCPTRDMNPDFSGELGAIYVLKAHQGQGIGTALVREVARFHLSVGRTSMIVWVLPQNPYRRFYEHLGGTLVGERVAQPHRLGVGPVVEVGYGWNDIRGLANLR